jgi:hypothetical protein
MVDLLPHFIDWSHTVTKELTEQQQHTIAMQKFLDLANSMVEEGMEINTISAALMTASGTYSTFAVMGDVGVLDDAAVERVAGAYKDQLVYIQGVKREQQPQS